jgi:CheY-like chemotaxis protein
VCQSSESLLNIINDILDFSRVEAGQLEILSRPVEIEPLVANLVRLLDGAARNKEIQLSYRVAPNVSPWLRCDPVRLEQILIDLVGNAIKFTERGLVSIDVTGAPEDRMGTVAFSVSDTGIGIPDEDLDRVFEPFTQYDGSMTRRHDGSGLGLSICRSLVSLMGGEIWVSSAPEVGSIFAFTLNAPAVTRSAVEAKAGLFGERAAGTGQSLLDLTDLGDRSRASVSGLTLQWTSAMAASASRLRVLVAEDNRVNRLVICRLLAQLGVTPVTVENGAEAINAVTQDRYDLVLMDISMPEVDGVEAVRVIRETVPEPPVLVALTAHALVGDRERFLDAGFDDYISKPVHPNELQKTVRRVVDSVQHAEGSTETE